MTATSIILAIAAFLGGLIVGVVSVIVFAVKTDERGAQSDVNEDDTESTDS